MPKPTSCPRTRRDVLVRLSLALLLTLAPLLALAQGPAGQTTADDRAGAAVQMPCHGAAADAGVSADPAPACPHCSDAMIAGHCDCCDQATPTGIAAVSVSTHFGFSGPDRYPPARLDPPAANPLDTPYRPPTQIR